VSYGTESIYTLYIYTYIEFTFSPTLLLISYTSLSFRHKIRTLLGLCKLPDFREHQVIGSNPVLVAQTLRSRVGLEKIMSPPASQVRCSWLINEFTKCFQLEPHFPHTYQRRESYFYRSHAKENLDGS
jgi:hypothetical protein